MSDYPIPAGLDQFIRCPVLGCETHVLSLTGRHNECKAHGGHLPEYRVTIDGILSAPAAGGPSPLAVEAPE